MKLLYDLFPIILFFVSYHQADKLVDNTPVGQLFDPAQPDVLVATIIATSIAIIASFIQVGGFWLKHRRFEKMHIFSLTLITVLGGITIVFGDPAFIQWKPTVLNWVFAMAFLASQFIGKKSLVQRMMGGQIELPDPVWIKLNISWVIFFLFSGVANLYVAFYYALELDEKTRMDNWVNFKLFGLMGMTFVFVIAQGFYLAKYMQDKQPEDKQISEE
ncbi:MAG: septation protein A [Gammaproteobacteria bacterium]|nr:septation protein A [Gammaproteobacteria bacterium]